MSEKRGTKALELWCRRITEGYPGVNIQNMTTSWRDGLAFCAVVHHFRPDLIDFDSLDKNDVYGNNELAFRIAEQHLGIPALLDAEDMASYSVPDRLSILTYLSQFYQTFAGSSPSRLALNRTTKSVDDRIIPRPESPKQKVASSSGMRRDLCVVCGLPVFLAEKLVIAHVAYHRTCFRCAYCNNQLTVGNYHETEEDQYCCETCPSDEKGLFMMEKYDNEESSEVSHRTARNNILDTGHQEDEVNEDRDQKVFTYRNLDPADYAVPHLIAQNSQLRVNFISNYLLSEEGPDIHVDDNPIANGSLDTLEKDIENFKLEATDEIEDSSSSYMRLNSASQNTEELIEEDEHVTKPGDRACANLSSDIRDDKDNVPTASIQNVIESKPTTSVPQTHDSERMLQHNDEHRLTEDCLSLVQRRLRMFESQHKEGHVHRKETEHQASEMLDSKIQSKEYSMSVTDRRLKDSITCLETTKSHKLDDRIKAVRSNAIRNSYEDFSALNRRGFSKSSISEMDTASDSQDIGLKSSTNNLNVEKDKQNVSTTVVSEVPLSYSWKVSNIPEVVHEKQENRKDIVTFVKETNQVYTKDASISTNEDYPEDLNPFKSDDEEDVVDVATVDSFKGIKNPTDCFDSEGTKEQRKNGEEVIVSLTPAARNNFSSSTPKQEFLTKTQTKRRLVAPQINLNPFWSDEEDHNSDLEQREESSDSTIPIPQRRINKHIQEIGIDGRQVELNYNNLHASTSSLTSTESGTSYGATSRKKKPAPPPPNIKELCSPDQQPTSLPLKLQNDFTKYPDPSPRSKPKVRKAKPAPPPPLQLSTSYNFDTTLSIEESSLITRNNMDDNQDVWGDKKINKDEANRSRRSLSHALNEGNFEYKSVMDKSTPGKWKRKKGPAPLCPMPYRRKVKVMSPKDVKLELDEIELQQQGLEKQGVRLEQLIRNKCESGSRTDDFSLGPDVEELVLELFALVNEKNELFRRQAELMLLRRQQRLEEEHAEIEYQVRCLMSQHDSTKTDFDKQREETLIQRLVEIVERRNEIVECLEMDRRREIEEDRSIHTHMGLFIAKNKSETLSNKLDEHRSSKTKKSKLKEKKSKGMLKKDVDKDVDETELKLKRHTKRKWF